MISTIDLHELGIGDQISQEATAWHVQLMVRAVIRSGASPASRLKMQPSRTSSTIGGYAIPPGVEGVEPAWLMVG